MKETGSSSRLATVRMGGIPYAEGLARRYFQLLRARHKAFRAANFYLEKAAATRGGAPFLAEQLRERALVCEAWLREALAAPFDGTTVVVTHFAPTLASVDPRYGLRPGTAPTTT